MLPLPKVFQTWRFNQIRLLNHQSDGTRKFCPSRTTTPVVCLIVIRPCLFKKYIYKLNGVGDTWVAPGMATRTANITLRKCSSLQSATSLWNPMRSERTRYWSLRTFTTGIRSVRISSIKIHKYRTLFTYNDPYFFIAVVYCNSSDQKELQSNFN